MSSLSFTLTIKMESDWHIGSGQGRHRSIDALIDRDHDGLPFAPSSTVRGMWRDGAETLAVGLDEGKGRAWAHLVEQVLGSQPAQPPASGMPEHEMPPLPSRLTLTDASLPDALRRHLAGDSNRTLREALTFTKPGVGIGYRSGRARDDFLRFEEVAREGTVLRAEGTLDCPAEHRRTVAAFLVAAAALVDRIGGKRRRGMGKCLIAVDFGEGFAGDAKAAAVVLRAAEAPTLAGKAPTEARRLGAASEVAGWITIPLRLKLKSPVIVADEVQGNVVTSLDSIPGSYLLADVARALEGAGMDDAWSRIAAGDVRVLPATPEIAGRRSLPVPQCWERPKGDKSLRQLRLVEHLRPVERRGTGDEGSDAEATRQHEPVRAGFLSTEAPAQLMGTVEKILDTHNTVRDDIQRPHEDVGGVYSYEAIAAGQVFRSEVWVREGSVDTTNLCLAGEVHLGRARRAGYGRVAVETLEATSRPEPPAQPCADGGLRIWLASDAVLPPGAAGGGLAVLADAVAGSLGGRCVQEVFDLSASWGSLRWRRIEGWQSQWGLPRPTLVALQAGSVAVLRLKPDVGIDTARLAAEGIGVRRGEGFGCVVVNHAFLSAAPTLTDPKEAKEEEATEEEALSDRTKEVALSKKEKTFLEAVHRRAWERCIALRAEAVAGARRKEALGWEPGKFDGRPNMSQLGALRAAIGELTPKDLERANAWIAHLKTVGNRVEGWPQNALTVLESLVKDPGGVWEKLELTEEQQAEAQQAKTPPLAGAAVPPAWSGLTPLTDPAMARFALRTLLLAAMRAHKRELERAELEEATS